MTHHDEERKMNFWMLKRRSEAEMKETQMDKRSNCTIKKVQQMQVKVHFTRTFHVCFLK